MGRIESVLRALASPLRVLEDWATEPLKKREHARAQESKDRDVERRIREQTGVEDTKARLERENASHNAELERQRIQEQRDAEEARARLAREQASHSAELEVRRIQEQGKAEEIRARLERENANHSAELEVRRIQEQAKAEEARARLERENASHNADLEVRMQTEIRRINTETEQWAKDKDLARMRLVQEAMAQFIERVADANLHISQAAGSMNLELRARAHTMISEKIREYK